MTESEWLETFPAKWAAKQAARAALDAEMRESEARFYALEADRQQLTRRDTDNRPPRI